MAEEQKEDQQISRVTEKKMLHKTILHIDVYK